MSLGGGLVPWLIAVSKHLFYAADDRTYRKGIQRPESKSLKDPKPGTQSYTNNNNNNDSSNHNSKKKRKKEIPYKEGDLKDIGSH